MDNDIYIPKTVEKRPPTKTEINTYKVFIEPRIIQMAVMIANGDSEEESIFSSDIEKKLEEMRQYKQKLEKEKQKSVVYDIPTPQYKETNFFDTYKNLKKNFKQKMKLLAK